MKHVQILFFVIFVFTTSLSLKGQDSWNLEFRGGADYATQDLGDADLDFGIGFEGTMAYSFMPHTAGYIGWSWNHFNTGQSFAGADVDFEETGYTFGLQFVHPLGDTQLSYLVRAGGLFNHIEAENQDGDIIGDSEHGLGWQVGAGLMIPLGSNWSLTPSVRYRSLPSDIEIGATTTAVDLNYISIGIGMTRSF
jgi:opacity protein-like surface antigen